MSLHNELDNNQVQDLLRQFVHVSTVLCVAGVVLVVEIDANQKDLYFGKRAHSERMLEANHIDELMHSLERVDVALLGKTLEIPETAKATVGTGE